MAKDPLKVVVRLLPPEITEEELIGTINATHIERTKWRSFAPGKRYKGEAKPSVNARCYFQFETLGYAEDFIKDYHGHQFIDGQGEQFRAVACFAPYQKVPRAKPQRDPRDGTILDDPVYKEFVESLAEASKVVYEAPPNPKLAIRPENLGDTPLLKYMQVRAKERRARAEKKENRRWRQMESIAEDKKAKWRCGECGTSKNLEEDPDNRGTFYCTYCWESWESQQAPAPKVKKKKKKSKEVDEGEWQEEETEEVTVKKKKKKKDKDREADEEPKREWRAKDKSGQGAEEDDAEKRRRKKSDRDRDRARDDGEEEDRGKNRWRVKRPEGAEEGYEQDWDADKHKSKARGSHKSSQDDWWEEDRSHKRSERRHDKSEKASADDGGGSRRWRAKAPTAAEDDAGEQEEKPRRKAKDKKGEGSESSYWRPKS